jgi:hypothetical protein
MRRKLALLWLGAGLLIGTGTTAAAGEPCPEKAAEAAPAEKIEYLKPRDVGPPPVACWAVPSDTGHYIGYYVGGGCVRHGRGPTPWEGTWGWDYCGCTFSKHIVLNWCCKYQGGIGAYRTTGPTNLRNKSTP